MKINAFSNIPCQKIENTDAVKLLACSVAAVLAPQLEASLHFQLYRSSQDGCIDVVKLLACSAASPLAPQVEASHCVEWFVCCFVSNGTVCCKLFWFNLTTVSLF